MSTPNQDQLDGEDDDTMEVMDTKEESQAGKFSGKGVGCLNLLHRFTVFV